MKILLWLLLLLVSIRVFAGEQNVNVDRVGGTQVGTTVPVSGTVTTSPPANASSNVSQFGGNIVVTGTGVGGAGIPRFTISSDSALTSVGSITNALPAGGNTIGSVNQGTGAALGNKWPVQVTDGTNTMPTADAAGRALFQKVTDGTNTATVKAASTAAVAADTALVVAVSPNGSNPCHNPSATLNALNVSLSGTTATQVIALSGSTKIYLCAMVVGWGGGTSPTFSLEYGTGTNCGTGTTVIVPATAITSGTPNTPAYPNDFFVTPAGQALCYILTGTSPTGKLIATYVQQ